MVVSTKQGLARSWLLKDTPRLKDCCALLGSLVEVFCRICCGEIIKGCSQVNCERRALCLDVDGVFIERGGHGTSNSASALGKTKDVGGCAPMFEPKAAAKRRRDLLLDSN